MKSTTTFGVVMCATALLSSQAFANDDSSSYSVSDFHTKLFWKRPDQGYYNVDVGLPANGEGSRIMAIGDLNNDKMNDLVMLDTSGKTLSVYYFDETTLKYDTYAAMSLPDADYTVDGVVLSAKPQSLQSLYVVASKTNSSGSPQETRMYQFDQKQMDTSDITTGSRYVWTENAASDISQIELYPGTQPLALDVNSDQAMDLLYQSKDDGIKVALGSTSDSDSFEKQSFLNNFVLSPSENSDCASPSSSDLISMPNSNAFVDFNGDCIPDLLLTRQKSGSDETYYEIYSQVFVDGESKYCLASQQGKLVDPTEVPAGTTGSAKMPFIEVADFNRDGMLDIAFATETGKLNILFNQYSAPGPKATNLCNDVGNTADLKTKAIFPSYPFSSDQNGVVQEVLDTTSETKIAFDGITDSVPQTSTMQGVAGRLRVQDVDQDGYPDIIGTLSFTDSSDATAVKSFTRTLILLNQDGNDGKREFGNVKEDDGSYLSKVIKIAGETGSFVTSIDIDDDGKLDFILQKEVSGVPSVQVLYNNIVSDNFFIKAFSVNSELKKSQNVYNNYSVGTSYRFVITDMTDTKLVTVGSQRFQSGYMSLQLPFAFLGVGRSNNYVETFYAATAIEGKRVEHMWTPIIPNSQLIIFMHSNDPLNWGLELFISPTASLYLIVLVCAICLLAIGLAIIWLHVQEKQEDAKKREQHFDFF